jgi:hypothetical protein
MAVTYLHEHKNFPDLLNILERETGIYAYLIEKDYWIMHVLYGLKKQGFEFELKGGTSLSKGYKIIHRFSEDIDIHIKPPKEFGINENPKNNKPNNIVARKKFYDWLANEIKIDGIVSAQRDTAFDDEAAYRSGGIRLFYESKTTIVEGVKDGILLEAGFDKITPNTKVTVTSWTYDKAAETPGIAIIDNRAADIACYHPGYTFVEKLQTIATKYRAEQESGKIAVNFIRQYYDVYCLLGNQQVLDFIGTDAYLQHKQDRFPKKDIAIPVAKNEAFLVSDASIRASFEKRYKETSKLYYQGQPDFADVLDKIQKHLHKL